MDCTIFVERTQLIGAFVFAFAKSMVSHDAAHMLLK